MPCKELQPKRAGVENVATHLDNNRSGSWLGAWRTPPIWATLWDEGGGVIDDELAEEGAGRRWNDHGPE